MLLRLCVSIFLAALCTSFVFAEAIDSAKKAPKGFPDIYSEPKFTDELAGDFIESSDEVLGDWYSRHHGVGGWKDLQLKFVDGETIELMRSGSHIEKARYKFLAPGCLLLTADDTIIRHVLLKRQGDTLFFYRLVGVRSAEELFVFTRDESGVSDKAMLDIRHRRIQDERYAFADSVLSAVRNHLAEYPRSLPASVGWLIQEEIVSYPVTPDSPSFYRPLSLKRYAELRESPEAPRSSYAVAIRNQADFTAALAAGQANPIIVWSVIHNPEGRHYQILVGRVEGDWEIMDRTTWQEELFSVKDEAKLN
ncbi:MAG: hypothetical protein AAF086_08915 [Planctomycetota bacterium]